MPKPLPVVTGTVLLPAPNTVFLTSNGLVLGTERVISKGKFRFLKDHFVEGEYIMAGEIRDMMEPWTPTSDVEPLDDLAVNTFYAMGPRLSGVIRSQFSNIVVYAPVTYWRNIGHNRWALTGLGSGLTPIPAVIGRIGDKEI